MNVHKYVEAKEKGTVTLERLGPHTYQVVSKNFDPANGKELPPLVEPIELAAVNRLIEELEEEQREIQAGIDAFNVVKADLEKVIADGGDDPAELEAMIAKNVKEQRKAARRATST